MLELTRPWLPVLLVALLFALWGLVRWSRRVRFKLSVREGDGLGTEFLVRGREATIGRDDDQTVVVSHPQVSRHHAVIVWEGGDYVLKDRSKHGLEVNGRSVETTPLRSGDLISVGAAVDLIFTRF